MDSNKKSTKRLSDRLRSTSEEAAGLPANLLGTVGDMSTHGDYKDLLNLEAFDTSEWGRPTAGEYDPLKSPKLLVSGCSETEGELLSTLGYEANKPYMWHSYISDYMNSDYTNLAVGGASIYRIVDKVFSYLRDHEPPEVIALLLPPINTRLRIAVDNSDQVNGSERKHRGFIDNRTIKIVDLTSHKPLMSISKKPHLLDTLLPDVTYIYFSLNSLKALEQYCEAANIELIYSTWDLYTDAFLKSAEEYFLEIGRDTIYNNYISTEPHTWDTDPRDQSFIYDKCHIDIKHKLPGNNFDYGVDDHMGAHRHAHIGELFVKELTKRGYTATV